MSTVIQLAGIDEDTTTHLIKVPNSATSRGQTNNGNHRPPTVNGLLGRIAQLWTFATTEVTDDDVQQSEAREFELMRERAQKEAEEEAQRERERIEVSYYDPLLPIDRVYVDDMPNMYDDLDSHYLIMHIYATGQFGNIKPLQRLTNLVSSYYQVSPESSACMQASKGGRMSVGGCINPWKPSTPSAATQSKAPLELVEISPIQEDEDVVASNESVAISFDSETNPTVVTRVELELANFSRDAEIEVKLQFGNLHQKQYGLFLTKRPTTLNFLHPCGVNFVRLVRYTDWSKYVLDEDDMYVYLRRTFRSLILLHYFHTYSKVKLPDLGKFDHVPGVRIGRQSWNEILNFIKDVKQKTTLEDFAIETSFYLPGERHDPKLQVTFNFQIHAFYV
jgi:hypothetical protein